MEIGRRLAQCSDGLEVALLLARGVLRLGAAQVATEAVGLDALEEVLRLRLLLLRGSAEPAAVPEVGVVWRVRIESGDDAGPARRVPERLEAVVEVVVALGLEVRVGPL